MRTVLSITQGRRFAPIGHVVDERCIVNAMVALLATGGSTNHLIHWVAVARAPASSSTGMISSSCPAVVPLLARVYPNGSADVNQFQAAGGPGYVIAQLLQAGLMHGDVLTVRPEGWPPSGASPMSKTINCNGGMRASPAMTLFCALPAAPSAHGRLEAAQRQSGPQRHQDQRRARRPPRTAGTGMGL
jgi:dihydroxyacid dehydratase/phosphogluconate dehydratase